MIEVTISLRMMLGGHQEDLQRRSILEVLTTELIKKEFLVGKGKVRLRNGDEKEDSWNSLLSLFNRLG